MTPAALHALLDVHLEVHGGESPERKVSQDPAADIAMLSAMTF